VAGSSRDTFGGTQGDRKGGRQKDTINIATTKYAHCGKKVEMGKRREKKEVYLFFKLEDGVTWRGEGEGTELQRAGREGQDILASAKRTINFKGMGKKREENSLESGRGFQRGRSTERGKRITKDSS